MQLSTLLASSEAEITNSPLRRCLESGFHLPVPTSEGLREIESQLRQLAAKLVTPMKIVLMGEVKAGKSTLLNAIAGVDVSITNVLEATASIIEIYHSDEPFGRLTLKNGTINEGTPEEIRRLLEERRGDEPFFAACERVEFGIPNENLRRYQMVDTPGLSTLTESNAARTRAFMQSADVILWVFNASHLGQGDVNDEMVTVAEMGKPIIGILNRIDEVDEDPQRLVRYLKRSVGLYLQTILPISGLKAMRGALTGDAAAISESGLSVLMEYLESNIARRADQVQMRSLAASLLALLRRERMIHQDGLRSLTEALDGIERHREETERQVRGIRDRLESFVLDQAGHFLDEEFRELKAQVSGLGFWTSKSDSDQIAKRASELVSEQNVMRWWQGVSASVDAEFRREWQQAMLAIQNRLQQELTGFAQENQGQVTRALNLGAVGTLVDVAEGAAKGAGFAAAVGVGFAGYAAWFGPAAAAISIGPALSVFVPPLAIGGAIVGAIGRFISVARRKDELHRLLDEQLAEARRALIERFLKSTVLPAIVAENEAQGRAHHERYIALRFPDWTEESLGDLRSQLSAYVARVEVLSSHEPEVLTPC